ncbi:MAG: ABC transporter permease [Treponema sp.]|nr:ABC transporter permease [Treponema sp.]
MVEGVLVEGLVYGILALGVFISFRILDFPDLTVEGSFPFGAAVGSALIAARFPPLLALGAGFLAGAVAGAVTSGVYHGLRVPPLLAGIVTMTGLYSVDLRVLGGKANLPLISYNPVMRAAESWLGGSLDSSLQSFLAFLSIAAALVLVLDLFFHTEAGIALGALGDNEASVVSAGVNPVGLRTSGICLANGLAGLSGAFAASYQGFADANFGAGIVAAGLASVMIGEFLFRTNRIGGQLARVLLGSILFRGIMYAGRSWGYLAGITPNDLRLLTAVLIVASIAASRYKGGTLPGRRRE